MSKKYSLSKLSKKGSLNMSIEVIVVVVIALTVLGLGVGFVQGMFDDIFNISNKAFGKISQQLTTDLATSNAPLLFSTTTLTIERGETSLEGFGVRNDGSSSLVYGIAIETFNCPDKEKSTPCNDISEWFDYFKGDGMYTLKAAETQTNRVLLSIPRLATPGTYLLKISAYTGEWSDGCVEATTCDIFGQTELFLTIN